MPLGVPELLIILAIVLLVLGPRRLPGLGRQLGGGFREFRDSLSRRHAADEHDAALERPPGDPPAPPAA